MAGEQHRTTHVRSDQLSKHPNCEDWVKTSPEWQVLWDACLDQLHRRATVLQFPEKI